MRDPDVSLEDIISMCKDNKENSGYLTVATLKGTGEVVGTCCFGNSSKKGQWVFGYSIKQEFWGKGYATEMVKAIIKFGSSLGIKDFISSCDIENIASGRVLAKCGMHINHKNTFKQPKTNIVYESHVYILHV